MELSLLRQAQSAQIFPTRRQGYIPRLKVNPGHSEEVVAVQDSFFRTFVTYDHIRGRTLWCGHGLDERCERCSGTKGPRIGSFLLVWLTLAKSMRVLELGEAAFYECVQITGLDGRMKGRKLVLSRGSTRKNAAVHVTVSASDRFFPAGLVVPEIREVLVTLFSFSQR